MAAKKLPTPKNKVVNHQTVTVDLPLSIYEPLMAEINAWNEREGDDADPAYFGPDAFEQYTQTLMEIRLASEKEAKPKSEKGERGSRRSDKNVKPDMHVVAQSA